MMETCGICEKAIGNKPSTGIYHNACLERECGWVAPVVAAIKRAAVKGGTR